MSDNSYVNLLRTLKQPNGENNNQNIKYHQIQNQESNAHPTFHPNYNESISDRDFHLHDYDDPYAYKFRNASTVQSTKNFLETDRSFQYSDVVLNH